MEFEGTKLSADGFTPGAVYGIKGVGSLSKEQMTLELRAIRAKVEEQGAGATLNDAQVRRCVEIFDRLNQMIFQAISGDPVLMDARLPDTVQVLCTGSQDLKERLRFQELEGPESEWHNRNWLSFGWLLDAIPVPNEVNSDEEDGDDDEDVAHAPAQPTLMGRISAQSARYKQQAEALRAQVQQLEGSIVQLRQQKQKVVAAPPARGGSGSDVRVVEQLKQQSAEYKQESTEYKRRYDELVDRCDREMLQIGIAASLFEVEFGKLEQQLKAAAAADRSGQLREQLSQLQDAAARFRQAAASQAAPVRVEEASAVVRESGSELEDLKRAFAHVSQQREHLERELESLQGVLQEKEEESGLIGQLKRRFDDMQLRAKKAEAQLGKGEDFLARAKAAEQTAQQLDARLAQEIEAHHATKAAVEELQRQLQKRAVPSHVAPGAGSGVRVGGVGGDISLDDQLRILQSEVQELRTQNADYAEQLRGAVAGNGVLNELLGEIFAAVAQVEKSVELRIEQLQAQVNAAGEDASAELQVELFQAREQLQKLRQLGQRNEEKPPVAPPVDAGQLAGLQEKYRQATERNRQLAGDFQIAQQALKALEQTHSHCTKPEQMEIWQKRLDASEQDVERLKEFERKFQETDARLKQTEARVLELEQLLQQERDKARVTSEDLREQLRTSNTQVIQLRLELTQANTALRLSEGKVQDAERRMRTAQEQAREATGAKEQLELRQQELTQHLQLAREQLDAAKGQLSQVSDAKTLEAQQQRDELEARISDLEARNAELVEQVEAGKVDLKRSQEKASQFELEKMKAQGETLDAHALHHHEIDRRMRLESEVGSLKEKAAAREKQLQEEIAAGELERQRLQQQLDSRSEMSGDELQQLNQKLREQEQELVRLRAVEVEHEALKLQHRELQVSFGSLKELSDQQAAKLKEQEQLLEKASQFEDQFERMESDLARMTEQGALLAEQHSQLRDEHVQTLADLEAANARLAQFGEAQQTWAKTKVGEAELQQEVVKLKARIRELEDEKRVLAEELDAHKLQEQQLARQLQRSISSLEAHLIDVELDDGNSHAAPVDLAASLEGGSLFDELLELKEQSDDADKFAVLGDFEAPPVPEQVEKLDGLLVRAKEAVKQLRAQLQQSRDIVGDLKVEAIEVETKHTQQLRQLQDQLAPLKRDLDASAVREERLISEQQQLSQQLDEQKQLVQTLRQRLKVAESSGSDDERDAVDVEDKSRVGALQRQLAEEKQKQQQLEEQLSQSEDQYFTERTAKQRVEKALEALQQKYSELEVEDRVYRSEAAEGLEKLHSEKVRLKQKAHDAEQARLAAEEEARVLRDQNAKMKAFMQKMLGAVVSSEDSDGSTQFVALKLSMVGEGVTPELFQQLLDAASQGKL